jgi:drug/metabolite transporter (DMT)-like permease
MKVDGSKESKVVNGKGAALPAIIVATALGASSGLYIKTLPFSSLGMAGFRMGIPFLFLLPYVLRRSISLGPVLHRKRIWLGSFLNALRMILYVVSFKLTTLTNAIVLLYTWPLFALLIHAATTRARLKIRETALLMTAFSGVVILNLHRDFSLAGSDLKGSLFMLASALIFALTTLIFKHALADHTEGEVLYFQNALGAIVFLPVLLLEFKGVPVQAVLTGVLYGFSVGIIGFGCFFFALKRLPVFEYSALGYIEVFFGVLMGLLFLGEDLRWNIILGGLLVLLPSFLTQVELKRKTQHDSIKQD